jgi:hypothetical protein
MKTIKTLVFAAPPSTKQTPILQRRAKLVMHLEHQKHLANDPLYTRKVQRWVIQDDGVKAPVEMSKRVRPWWRTDETGAIYLKVCYGARAIEFEKGKSAILIKEKAKLLPTIETLITAIQAGELDEQLAQQAGARPAKGASREKTEKA